MSFSLTAVGDVEKALQLSDKDFKRKYGVPKPSKENPNVIFYCRSGRRTAFALATAQSLGYDKARIYQGSWNEWVWNQ
jgi:3-mercaptopyruvate sulfurtransferase SseA